MKWVISTNPMQNNEQNIDQLFQSKLSGFEVTPPAEVWDRISDSMGYTRRRKRALFIWSLSGAASLLFAFLMGWYLSGRTSFNDQLMADLDNYRLSQKSRVVLESTIQQNVVMNFERPKFLNYVYDLSNSVEKQNTTFSYIEEQVTLKQLSSLETAMLPGFNQFPGLVNLNEGSFFTASDKAIIEANLLAMNTADVNKNEGNWSVGVNASPVYRFNPAQAVNKDASPSFDMVQNQVPSNYQTNLSGGFSFAYETGKRLDIISGVNYAEVAQNTGEIALSFLGHNWLNDRADMNFYAESPTNEVISSNSSNNLILNTQVGLANINLPVGASVASAKTISSLVPDATQNYDYKQQARYIEVPLLMRYHLIEKKLGLHVIGGFNSNVLVDNTVRLIDQNTVVASGKIEGLRPVTWSSSLGVGMNYELTEHFNLNFEPTLKIQLNSLNSQTYFNARPYAFGVFSGVSYRF